MSNLQPGQGYRTGRVLADVMNERMNQIEKWGDQSHLGHLSMGAILSEEVGEVWQVVTDGEVVSSKPPTDLAHLREELIQVAACAVQWVEAIDKEQS